jgi:AraC-like DNA-binding protein
MHIQEALHIHRIIGGQPMVWHGRYHAHNEREYELHVFLEGRGVFLLNTSRYTIAPEQLICSGPREFHSLLPAAVSRPLSYYAFLLQVNEHEDVQTVALLQKLRSRNPLALQARDRFLFEELHRLCHQNGDAELARSAQWQLLSILGRLVAGGEQKAALPGNADARSFIAHTASAGRSCHSARTAASALAHRALTRMKESVETKLQVQDLAQELLVSPEHLIRVFKAELGMTPLQYFTRLKIEAASGLLENSSRTIASIAASLGFENPFHFSRVFKSCTGLSPRVYRMNFQLTRV